MGDSQALVTGCLAGLISGYTQDQERGVLVDKVEPVRDDQGNYLPLLRLTMRSGAKLLVAVMEDTG